MIYRYYIAGYLLARNDGKDLIKYGQMAYNALRKVSIFIHWLLPSPQMCSSQNTTRHWPFSREQEKKDRPVI